jgi:hypothetical protein
MSSTLTDAEKKAYRPFRGLMWIAYLIFAVGFSLLIIVSVFSSAIRMTPSRPATGTQRSLEVCFESTDALYQELGSKYDSMAHEVETQKADYQFLLFRNDWIARKRSLEAECQLDDPARTQLKTALDSLEKIADAYTTSSVQFVNWIGPELTIFRQAMKRAPTE